MKTKVKGYITGLLCVLFLVSPLFSQGKKRITFGFYSGWSFGTSYAFRWHVRPYSDRYGIQYHLGGYIQFDLCPHFGLQFDANYQRGKYEWTFDHPSFPPDFGEEGFDFVSLTIKGLYSFKKWGKFQLYFAGGGGLSNGQFESFDGVYFNLTAGPGIKIFLGGPDSGPALNLGSSFVFLLDPEEYDTFTASYLRVFGGIEF
ncbi:MAG: hypothetical protein JXB26_00785 [Candidatus Aminicenantes bacterium]|nr:hypothetical protein [Candidatus Aminicenantes bacterium]